MTAFGTRYFSFLRMLSLGDRSSGVGESEPGTAAAAAVAAPSAA